MADRSLTIRGVKRRLTAAGVDWSPLNFSEQRVTSRTWRDATGSWGQPETYTEVRIEGPKDARDKAYWALFTKGLSVAGYPEYSLWCRR
jgi:hypothetical protein